MQCFHVSLLPPCHPGRFDVPKEVRVCYECSCEEMMKYDLSNIIFRGFWPANPDLDKSCYLFDVRVLDMWRNVYRHLPGASLSGFVGALNETSEKYGRVRFIFSSFVFFCVFFLHFPHSSDQLISKF